MASTRTPKGNAAGTFRNAIEAAECLQWRPGLQAVTAAEGKGQIVASQPSKLLGGAFIDEDCETSPLGKGKPRWDYVLGYERANQAVAHFVEVHPAESSDVDDVAKKLDWLRHFLNRTDQANLNSLNREFHWVAAGRINILQHTPQFKRLRTSLRKLGLNGPVKHLTLV